MSARLHFCLLLTQFQEKDYPLQMFWEYQNWIALMIFSMTFKMDVNKLA